MTICASCCREMRCVKTGMSAVWGEAHTYRGDLFKCPKCNAEVLVTNNASHHDGMVRKRGELFLDMEPPK